MSNEDFSGANGLPSRPLLHLASRGARRSWTKVAVGDLVDGRGMSPPTVMYRLLSYICSSCIALRVLFSDEHSVANYCNEYMYVPVTVVYSGAG